MAKTKSEFVKLRKAGEEDIDVHPSVVDDHKRLGWKVVEEAQAPADEGASVDEKKEKEEAKAKAKAEAKATLEAKGNK
jgi:hypothetical protein